MKYEKHEVLRILQNMIHSHYCENDPEAIIRVFDSDIVWFGAGEKEYASGYDTVADIFRSFKGMVPKCNLEDEDFTALELAPHLWLCTGRYWVSTDPSTQISLRAHQRITTVFRFRGNEAKCCHIHISNPYDDMDDDDVGFPSRIAGESYRYLQEQLEAHKNTLNRQSENLRRMAFEDSLTDVYNKNMFDMLMRNRDLFAGKPVGIAFFDVNDLKKVNDYLGHSAGDELIRNTAAILKESFPDNVYRIGGDEFVIIDQTHTEDEFRSRCADLHDRLIANRIHIAMGLVWDPDGSNIHHLMVEADKQMYKDKSDYYNHHYEQKWHR